MRKTIFMLISVLIILSGIYLARSLTGERILIERNDHNTTYSFEGIPILLEASHGVNEGTWRFRPRSAWEMSDRPIDWQINVMEKLLAKALSDQKRPPRTLSAGRLEESFGSNKEISKRLALAAKASPLWARFKAKMSSPRWDATTDPGNNEVAAILNDGQVYRELIEMFRGHGLIIRVKYVEKVLIGKDKLPFDCQVWFSVAAQR